MKRIKRLFAFVIVFCMTLSVLPTASFAYTVSDNGLTVGTNIVSANTAEETIFEFVPGEAGVFTVTTSTEGATLYTAGGSAFFVFNIVAAENNTITFDITETYANTPQLVGVTGAGDVTVVIEKTGDSLLEDPNSMPFTMYETTADLMYDFSMDLRGDESVTYVDVTEAHSAVLGDDGYYHLDAADGEILYVNIGSNAPYIALAAAYSYGQVRCHVYDGDELVEKIDFYDCLTDYFSAMDRDGFYPMTADLIEIMKTLGEAKGWYDMDRELGSYLFGTTVIDEATGWMCTAAYVEGRTAVEETETVYGTSLYGDEGNLLAGSGTLDDPFELEETTGFVNYYTLVEDGSAGGYYHEFVAPASGELTVLVYAGLMEMGWQYRVSNLTADAEGDMHSSNDDENYSESEVLNVSESDVIRIYVSTYDPENTASAPEGFIDWAVELAEPLGTESNPYDLGIYNDTDEMTVAAGETAYFAIYYSAGSAMEITGEGAFSVTLDGVTADAADGAFVYDVVGFYVEGYITNNSTSEQTYSVSFTLPEGTANNPEVIEDGEYTVSMDETSSDGYYYTWTAPSDGTATITVNAEKSTNSWEFTCDKIPADPEDYAGYVYGEWYTSEDEPVVLSQTVEVSEGETLNIYVGTLFNYDNGLFDEGDVVWSFSFVSDEVPTEEPTAEPTAAPTQAPVQTSDSNASAIAVFAVIAVAAAAAFVFIKKRSSDM